jgi:diacylglycerol kinase (ATP)
MRAKRFPRRYAEVFIAPRDVANVTETESPAVDPATTLESPHKGQRGVRRLFNAFFYSLSGLRIAFNHESALRQEIAIAVVLVPIACVVPVGAAERVLLIGSVLLLLIVELLNSSVEAAIDRIGFDTHRLSKRAKDLGSAAVFLTLVLLATTWGLVAGPTIASLIRAAVSVS